MSDEGQRADFANKNEEGQMRPAAVTLAPGDKIPSQTLAFAAVTADVTESPEGDAEPDRPAAQQAAPSHPPGNRRANAASTAPVDAMPRWLRRQIEQDLPRIAEACVPPPNAHFVDGDAKIPRFLRRQGVTSLDLARAQPIASDRVPSEGSQADQPSGFVPRELREGLVTFPVTPSPAPTAASVTTGVTTPIAGSICPTCKGRVRMSDAERQRARRARQREQGKLVP
jgi:hypothetical protein